MGTCIAKGSLPPQTIGLSSTLRELVAVRLVLSSLASVLSGCEVVHRSDNQAAVAIIQSGSRHGHLQDEAIAIFQLRVQHQIILKPQWIPRTENERADFFSKLQDTDDWQLSPDVFNFLDSHFGPHCIDRFATPLNAQLPRFCSRWWSPGCEVVDAFTVSWQHKNNWIVPPIHLISRSIRHLLECKADGTLVIPLWQSAVWWPLLCKAGIFRKEVIQHMIIPRRKNLFVSGSSNWNLFSKECPSCDVLGCALLCM